MDTASLDHPMDSINEPFSTQLIKACHCDVMLFEEVIQRYVSSVSYTHLRAHET